MMYYKYEIKKQKFKVAHIFFALHTVGEVCLIFTLMDTNNNFRLEKRQIY